MKRMHKPEDEKRSLVIVPRDEWDDWLNCTDPEYARAFMNLYSADLMRAWPKEEPTATD
jgi:putative SOS response-associated peptidase YedK